MSIWYEKLNDWLNSTWFCVCKIIGDQGPDGFPGPKGIRGNTGLYGPRGDIGLPGTSVDGPEGLKGYPGKSKQNFRITHWKENGDFNSKRFNPIKGMPGPNGPMGADGEPGRDGETGLDGLRGMKGYRGENGRALLQGEFGEQGKEFELLFRKHSSIICSKLIVISFFLFKIRWHGRCWWNWR